MNWRQIRACNNAPKIIKCPIRVKTQFDCALIGLFWLNREQWRMQERAVRQRVERFERLLILFFSFLPSPSYSFGMIGFNWPTNFPIRISKLECTLFFAKKKPKKDQFSEHSRGGDEKILLAFYHSKSLGSSEFDRFVQQGRLRLNSWQYLNKFCIHRQRVWQLDKLKLNSHQSSPFPPPPFLKKTQVHL